MTFMNIFTEPAILIITAIFLFFIMTTLRNYNRTEKNLNSVYQFLQSMNKKEISYRFNVSGVLYSQTKETYQKDRKNF